MVEWTRTGKTVYWLTVVLLAFGVAWSLVQIIELRDRAEAAEAAVELLLERPPRMPAEWTFDIQDGSRLHCQRLGTQDVYYCTPLER